MSTTTEAATWPRVAATLNADGTAEVSIGGTVHPIAATSVDDARTQTVALVAQKAAQLGRPLRVVTQDPDGAWPLIIHADGTVEPDESTEAAAPPAPAPTDPVEEPVTAAVVEEPEQETSPAAAPPEEPDSAAPHGAQGWVRSAAEQSAEEAETQPYPSRRERQSFLTQERAEEPATTGWRGALARVGIRVTPSDSERAERDDVRTVSQHWPGPRTIAIVNGKGGANKTPTTILLGALFARYGGAGVLAWDNNQTRGTLGWRTEQGRHEATLLDLLPRTDHLLSASAQSADLAHFVHHQTADKYDVLRSKPDVLASEQRISAADVDAIHAVAAKYYRLIFIDSGNDETDPLWRRMLDHTDQLVVATTTLEDRAEAGSLLLEALRDQGGKAARLADEAVVIVSQDNKDLSAAHLKGIADGFSAQAREAVTIPYDPAMVKGTLRYGALRPATQRAWLAAGAAVARGL